MKMKLSENFTLEEFVRSDIATDLQIENVPDELEIDNLKKLTIRLLQPLRLLYGKSFHINSGYRCPQLNEAVGGVATSQHMRGQAADIRVDDPRALLTALLKSRLDFDQAILYPTFLHLSYNSGQNRKQVLYAKGIKP